MYCTFYYTKQQKGDTDMSTSTAIFAENLRQALYKKNKSQSDLARFLKVTPTTVSRWTAGEAMPRANMLDRICAYLLCTPEDLLTDHTQTASLFPEDVIAEAIVERPLLLQLFLMADKADDDAIRKCIKMLGERK